METHIQARNQELYQRATAKVRLRVNGSSSASIKTPRGEGVSHLVEWECSRYVRLCCPLRGKGWAFDKEGWSISFWCDHESSCFNNVLIVVDEALLGSHEVSLTQFAHLVEIICARTDVISGVCDIGPWHDTIGGMYYTREYWSGYPAWRRIRRVMWMEGLCARELVRDIGWLTIVGQRVYSKVSAWPSICSGFETFADGTTSIRQQRVLHMRGADVFAVSSSMRLYASDPLNVCSGLSGWLAARLREAGVLM